MAIRHKQSETSRADILRAAVETIADRGCHGATIARIAKDAGLSTAAVFWHFQDKSGLLKAVATAFKEQWVEQVKVSALAEASGRQRLQSLISNHCAWARQGTPEMRAFVLIGLEARGLGEGEAAEYVAEMLAHWEQFLAELIRDGQVDGTLPVSLDAATAACTLANWLLGAIVRQRICGEASGPGDDAALLLQNIFGIEAIPFPARE